MLYSFTKIHWKSRRQILCHIVQISLHSVFYNNLRSRRSFWMTSSESPLGMMTPSNGNIFRVLGHLCGEFTGDRWIPRTNGQWHGTLMFSLISAWIDGWVNNGEADDLRRYRAYHDVTVMCKIFHREHACVTVHSPLCLMMAQHHEVLGHLQAQWWPDVGAVYIYQTGT